MLALFAIFEHLSNVRRLFNRFYSTEKSNEQQTSIYNAEQQQHEILLRPIIKTILSDNRLKVFPQDFQDDFKIDDYLASELDACLLELRELERDLNQFKQRQCQFYESYIDFIDRKDQLIEKFIDYHDEYLPIPSTTTTKQLRKQSTIYEFNIPVSNRFELLKRQHT